MTSAAPAAAPATVLQSPPLHPHAEAARIAAEVASRYGVIVAPEVVRVAPPGASAYVWNPENASWCLPGALAMTAAERSRAAHSARCFGGAKGARAKAAEGAANAARVLALHGDGRTPSEIAAQTGLHYGTVLAHIHAAGETPITTYQARLRRLRTLVSQGMAAPDIAAELGLKPRRLHETAKAAGVVLHWPNGGSRSSAAGGAAKPPRARPTARAVPDHVAMRRARVRAILAATPDIPRPELAAQLGISRATLGNDIAAVRGSDGPGTRAARAKAVAAMVDRIAAMIEAAAATGAPRPNRAALAADLGVCGRWVCALLARLYKARPDLRPDASSGGAA